MKKKNLSKSLKIKESRSNRSYTFTEYIGRFLWTLVTPLFFLSPRPFFGWRSFLLRLFGAKVGRYVHIYPSAKIYIPWNLVIGDESSIGEWVLIYNLGLVNIGKQTTISHRAHICAGTHDYSSPSLPLLRNSVKIGSKVWICSDAFVGPNIKIGDGAIIAAAAVVVKNVSHMKIVAGNPAKYIKRRRINYTSN